LKLRAKIHLPKDSLKTSASRDDGYDKIERDDQWRRSLRPRIGKTSEGDRESVAARAREWGQVTTMTVTALSTAKDEILPSKSQATGVMAPTLKATTAR